MIALSVKERRQDAGAKVQGTANTRPDKYLLVGVSMQSTKFRTSIDRGRRGSVVRENPHNSSALRPLTTSELIRETQSIVLQFSTSQVADEQGACMRAVENQRNGESAISLRAAINWCRRNPRVRAEFARLMGCEGFETNPDFVQGISLLINQYVRDEAQAEQDSGGGATPVADLFEGA